MPSNNAFVIESEPSRHRLFLNGREFGTFATVDAAEKKAAELADRAVPGATLRFELDFKWTLTDLEIRAATLQWDSEQPVNDMRPSRGAQRDGSAIGGAVCGS
jgi:hypothetical protein